MVARLLPNPRRMAQVLLVVTAAAVLLSFFTGRLVSRLVALPEGSSGVAPAARAHAEGRAEPRVSRQGSLTRPKSAYLDPILRRNIFDSTAVGMTMEPGEVGEAGRRSDLNATLIATVVAEPEEFSSALISSPEGPGGGIMGYGIGDMLLEEAEVIRIEQKKVTIRRSDGTIEYIDTDGKGSVARGVAPVAIGSDSEDGVTKLSDTNYLVDASFLEEALSSLDELITQVRATPYKSDGDVVGFRLSAIRRGSTLQKLGIRNGDVIHSVNGMPLVDATGAMGAFQQLQSERSFQFEITRRNNKSTYEYEIR